MSNRIVRQIGLAMLGLMVAGAATARAQVLDPMAFQPIAASFPSETGYYMINTSGPTPTMELPDTTLVTGVYSSTGIAVFDYGSVNIVSGASILVTGSAPVALLSQSEMTVAGVINGSGGNATTTAVGGPGGYAAGTGPGAGSIGSSAFVPQPGAPGYGT